MDSESELYKITVYVMGHGYEGEKPMIRELAFALNELDRAAREYIRLCSYGEGISWEYLDKVMYYPHHSIARVETSNEVYSRALELERERRSQCRVRGKEKTNA